MSLNMIRERLKIISDLNEELNRLRALYDESLENDSHYMDFKEKETEFKKEAKSVKEKLDENKTIKAMNDELKDLRADIKDNKELLAQELADYYKESGQMDFEDLEGHKKRIVFSVRVVDFKG